MIQPDAMTQYELHSLTQKAMELSIMMWGVLITIISGFLVMSYVVGDKLSKRQLWLVVPIFIFFASMAVFGITFFRVAAESFQPANWIASGGTPAQASDVINTSNLFAQHHMALTLGALLIIGSLMFLRDVRKKAAEAAEQAQEKAGPLGTEAAPAVPEEPLEPSEPETPAAADDQAEAKEPKE